MAKTKKSYFGENNSNWKNARKNCLSCGIRLHSYSKKAKYHRECYLAKRKIDGQPEWVKEKIKNSLKGKNTREKNPAWKGGFFVSKRGYVYVKNWDHPHRLANNYIAEHRLVMEKNLGRYLLPTEVVHHINHIKNDNRPENLLLLNSQSEHRSIEAKGNKIWVGKKHKKETLIKMSIARKKYWEKKHYA
ncbi:MAG: HNH endonuclease [Patescibacteria group bacterium]